jgi:uncharacterized protein (DUF952 family)
VGDERIFHIAFAADWEAALADGEYRVSTRGRTLEEEGFIHCSSSAQQVRRVAGTFYAGADGLVLLTIDPFLVGAPVRWEPVGDSGEEYPHIYGPLPVGAVVAVHPLPA